jgi:hypothetical protein
LQQVDKFPLVSSSCKTDRCTITVLSVFLTFFPFDLTEGYCQYQGTDSDAGNYWSM